MLNGRQNHRRPPSTDIVTDVSLHFRPAIDSDLHQLHQIINRAYRTKTDGWQTVAHVAGDERISLEELRAQLERQRLRPDSDPIFVCELQQQQQNQHIIIGSIQAELAANHPQMGLPSNSALLGLLAVDPHHQSRGVGRFLLHNAMSHLKSQFKLKTAVLCVVQQRVDIQQWYERHGFRVSRRLTSARRRSSLAESDVAFNVFTRKLV